MGGRAKDSVAPVFLGKVAVAGKETFSWMPAKRCIVMELHGRAQELAYFSWSLALVFSDGDTPTLIRLLMLGEFCGFFK